ncbi:MAG TPA: arsenate reductase family protein [Desulfosporosinus sp.]|nr:arsenate reductase family protein [Desulfosporosinus sp.]
MFTFYCYPQCTTCRKAEAGLLQESVKFEYRNIVKNSLSVVELFELAKFGGIAVQGLLNKRSKTYKELGKELEESNELAVASFLAANPKAMIRPLIAGNNKLIIGFKPGMEIN